MTRAPKRDDVTPKRSEHAEQCAVIEWALAAEARLPALRLLHAIPNGGKRNIVTAMKLKAEGVKRGVPDLCLPYPMDGNHGLYIEMKARDGRLSDNQKWWIDSLLVQGYRVEVCYSADEAIKVLREYIHDEELTFVDPISVMIPRNECETLGVYGWDVGDVPRDCVAVTAERQRGGVR